jgi:hypothetical protein
MIITNINLRVLLQSLIGLMLFSLFFRAIAGGIYGLFELLSILVIIALSLFYYVERNKIESLNLSASLYLFFIAYLLIITFASAIIRSIDYNVEFYSLIFAGLYEFKIASMAFIFPFLFLVINKNNQSHFENFLMFILKISIIYTIMEQALSLIGFRDIFLKIIDSASPNSIVNPYATRLGLYRIFGIVGGPHILGLLHIIGFLYFLKYNKNGWAALSLISVIFSTSVTAYAVLTLVFFLYLLYTKKYLSIVSYTLIIATAIVAMYLRYDYLMSISINSYNEYAMLSPIDKLILNISGYFTLISSEIDPITSKITKTGPLSQLIIFFKNHPELLIFGKGTTYNFSPGHFDMVQIHNFQMFVSDYKRMSSDFYILNFLQQYGLIGLTLKTLVFFIVPFFKLAKDNIHHVLILNSFIISAGHYNPAEYLFFMIFVSYSIYVIYFMRSKNE